MGTERSGTGFPFRGDENVRLDTLKPTVFASQAAV